MGFLGIPAAITQAINELNLSPYMLMLLLGAVYIMLGCLLDGFSGDCFISDATYGRKTDKLN